MTTTAELLIAHMKETLTEARFHHVIGAWQTAVKLARRHGVDEEKATQAALLHDVARGMSTAELVAYTRERRLRAPFIGELLGHAPALLHGFVGADIARRAFGVTDRSVLQAIAWHTFARPGIDPLGKIVYVADSTSPDRRYPGVQTIRRVSMQDLDRAYQKALSDTIGYLLKEKGWIHPFSIRAWNETIGRHAAPPHAGGRKKTS